MRSAPGIVFPDSRSTVVSTMPGTSVLSVAASRPFSGSSTMRFESTTSLRVAEVTSTVGDSPDTVTRFREAAELEREVHREVLVRLQQHAFALRRSGTRSAPR